MANNYKKTPSQQWRTIEDVATIAGRHPDAHSPNYSLGLILFKKLCHVLLITCLLSLVAMTNSPDWLQSFPNLIQQKASAIDLKKRNFLKLKDFDCTTKRSLDCKLLVVRWQLLKHLITGEHMPMLLCHYDYWLVTNNLL